MKNWTFTAMEKNPKLQSIIEKSMWLEQELTSFLKTADCRKSKEVLQVTLINSWYTVCKVSAEMNNGVLFILV